MIHKLLRYYFTLKELKFIQIRYQVWYRLKNKFFPTQYPDGIKAPKYQKIQLCSFPEQYVHYLGNNQFQFLNLDQKFKSKIDWNYSDYGKLWAYHLNYFDFLHQPEMDWETGKQLIDDFNELPHSRSEGLDPYPISLRTINWIKFLAVEDKYPIDVVNSIYAQYQVLTKKIEYHLLGNHLLENGFSLLFGAVFFQDKNLIKLARKILLAELEEQILEDGAHFELSPMYHLIILQRALDGYNLLRNNEHNLQDVEQKLKSVIQKMVNWLHTLMFGNGDIPMFNDSVSGQALSPTIIMEYAKQQGFTPSKISLSDSGYRKLESDNFELIADVGNIAPTYQPGHAHADALSYVMYYQGKPMIVDCGISTYEKNNQRRIERSTAFHNTVVIRDTNQSDIWGGFRVGKRAKTTINIDAENKILASNDGYARFGVIHKRSWETTNNTIKICDSIGKNKTGISYIHFHPDTTISIKGTEIVLNDIVKILLEGKNIKLNMEDYQFCEGFNLRTTSKKVCINFEDDLTCEFYE